MAQNLTNDAAFQISRGAQDTAKECTETIEKIIQSLTNAIEETAKTNEKVTKKMIQLNLILSLATLVLAVHALIQIYKIIV